MLDDESKDFRPTHEIYSHFSQVKWDAVEQLSSTIGQGAVGAILSAMGTDGQHPTIAKLIQNGIDAERKTVSLASPTRVSTDIAVDNSKCSTVRTVETAAGCCYQIDTRTSTRLAED